MKHAKKLVSLLLTLAMVLSMGILSFAADSAAPADPATPATPATPSHTYEVYQIFTGTFSDGVLTNVKWGQNGTGYVENEVTAVSETILTELTKVTNSTSDTEKLAVIKKYAKLENPIETGSATSYTGLAAGYYLIKDQDGTQDGEGKFYTLYVVKVTDGTLTFAPKGDVPSADKKIVEGNNNKVETNEASIGDTVSYEITGTLPTNIADYKEYYYVFTDTLSKGLTYKDNTLRVLVRNDNEEDVDVTQYFYKSYTPNPLMEGEATTITVGIQDLLQLKNLHNPNYPDDPDRKCTINLNTEIIVTYDATLNKFAEVAGAGNPNDVVLSYFNDPNNSGKGTTAPPDTPKEPKTDLPVGTTPRQEVVTYTTELTILKTDSTDKILAGAEFTLTSTDGAKMLLVTEEKFVEATDGTYYKLKNGTYTETAPTQPSEGNTGNVDQYVSTTIKYKKNATVVLKGENQGTTEIKGFVDPSTGMISFSGLGAGTYTLTESVTPEGYNTISPVTFTISFDAANKKFKSDNTKIVVGADNKLDTTIVNQKGSELPTTGGIGTTIFYVVGSILLVGAAILLITKRRMRVAE